MKYLFSLFIALSLVGAGCTSTMKPSPTSPTPTVPVACTMEAKICPDGSAVGRSGPNCEFAPCPGGPSPAPAY